MALAEFFDKAALGAAHVLHGFNHQQFSTILEASPVGVAFDQLAASSFEGRTTIELTINLLARLYPRLVLVPEGAEAEAMTAELADLACAINPRIEIGMDVDGVAAIVSIGTTARPDGSPAIYAGSDGWVARLSSSAPVGCGSSDNPFGAAAAACIATADVFRQLFADFLPGSGSIGDLTFSLIDLKPNNPHPANPILKPIDLGESFLVGVGAIGNAATWSVARTPGLSGVLHLVDSEDLDLSNLQRYVLGTHADIGKAKVDIAQTVLAQTGLTVLPYPGKWAAFLDQRNDWYLERVAVAIDTEADRIAVQAALPRWIVNAWTQAGDLGVSRHAFLGSDACLACLYPPDRKRKNEDELVAEAVGLPSEVMEVRRLLATGAPVDSDFLERVAAALYIPVEPLLRFEGAPLRSFYTGAICGGIVLGLGGQAGAGVRGAAVPMVFQSAFAGVLLAAELVINAGGLRVIPTSTMTKVDLLSPIGQYLSLRAAKPGSGRCICQDLDYVDRYIVKYKECTNDVGLPL